MRYYTVLLGLIMLLPACTVPKRAAALKQVEDLRYPFAVRKQKLSGGVTVAYTDQGAGPTTIVFVHGLGSYLPAWKKNLDGLRGQYRCIALDLPGYGKSSKGDYDGSMGFYAGVVREFVRKLNLKKVVLAGHSMGGQIAVLAALQEPALVEKLVLISPAGLETFTEAQRELLRRAVTPEAVCNTTEEQVRANLAQNFYELPADAHFMIDDRLAMRAAEDFPRYCRIIPQNIRGMVDEPVFERLPQLRQPALVVFGENDNLIPNRYLNPGATADVMRRGADRLPQATVVAVARAGHFVQWEKAAEVNEAIRGFLK
jgi:pimeloyl-ACP methyl ester carboxylesterase